MPAKIIPQTRIEKDARWLSEDGTVAFIIEQLSEKGLILNLSIIDLLKSNRRNPQYQAVSTTSGIKDIPTCGNRQTYGHCKFYRSSYRNRIHYWRPDVVRWLENNIYPRCKPTHKEAA